MLYPIGSLRDVLVEEPGLAATVHELLEAVKADDLRGEGRIYGGGLHKIDPKELGRISAEVFLEKIRALRERFVRQASWTSRRRRSSNETRIRDTAS